MENDRNEQLEVLNGLILELRILLDMSVREGDSLTAERCSKQLSAVCEACRQLQNAPMSDQDRADLDLIHRIRSGELKKCVTNEYTIINGDFYRTYPPLCCTTEPRVLTLDEAAAYLGQPVWVEEKNVDTVYCEVLFDVDGKAFKLTYGQIEFGSVLTGHSLFSVEFYGDTFRFWTAKPTDEQREAVKW